MLIGINIVTEENELLNKNKFPLLLYLNDDNELLQYIQDSDEFKEYLLETIGTQHYIDTTIYCFSYDNGEYKEETTSTQEIIPFSALSNGMKENIIKKYILPKISLMFYEVFDEYAEDTDIFSKNNDLRTRIIMMCSRVKVKYPERIDDDTILNYIRSKMIELNEYGLFTDDTKKTLFKYVENIFKN